MILLSKCLQKHSKIIQQFQGIYLKIDFTRPVFFDFEEVGSKYTQLFYEMDRKLNIQKYLKGYQTFEACFVHKISTCTFFEL